jgi:Protein of unknown function (DUF2628)
MTAYTVHEPPLRAADSTPDTGRFVFVRDGFSFWAFLIAPWWMLWHRMWLVLVGYLAGVIIVIAVLAELGASHGLLVVAGLLISLLVGLESSTLRRFTLRRRGWKAVGIVSGDDLEDAERRFFGFWLRQTPVRPNEAGIPPAAAPRSAEAPKVVGLFPEPGAQH